MGRAVIFVLAFVILTVNWPVPASVYCSTTSNSIFAQSKHHILLTMTSKTFAHALINTYRQLFCMLVVSGAITWNILISESICLSNFELSLRRNFFFGWRLLARWETWVLL